MMSADIFDFILEMIKVLLFSYQHMANKKIGDHKGKSVICLQR